MQLALQRVEQPPPLLGSCQRTLFLQLPWSWEPTTPQLQAGTDEPFSQEATGISPSLPGESPNQMHRATPVSQGKGIREELGVLI